MSENAETTQDDQEKPRQSNRVRGCIAGAQNRSNKLNNNTRRNKGGK